MQLPTTVLLAGCAAGLGCSLITGTGMPESALARPLLAQANGLKDLAGSQAAGTKTNSPFAGAKESDAAARTNLRADRARLWWLLLPVGVAAISYGALRSQEGHSGS